MQKNKKSGEKCVQKVEKRYGRKRRVYTKKKSFQRVMHREGKEKSGERRK